MVACIKWQENSKYGCTLQPARGMPTREGIPSEVQACCALGSRLPRRVCLRLKMVQYKTWDFNNLEMKPTPPWCQIQITHQIDPDQQNSNINLEFGIGSPALSFAVSKDSASVRGRTVPSLLQTMSTRT